MLFKQENLIGATREIKAGTVALHWQGTVMAWQNGVLATALPTAVVVSHAGRTVCLEIPGVATAEKDTICQAGEKA